MTDSPADRAAVYAEVADRLAADAEQGDKDGLTRIYRRSAATQVRGWADELAAVSVPAPAPTTQPGTWFDRTVCPEPCGAMHTRCTGCGTPVDGCPLEQTAAADRAAILQQEVDRIRAHCPDHLDADSAPSAWMVCHCDVADDMQRRIADGEA